MHIFRARHIQRYFESHRNIALASAAACALLCSNAFSKRPPGHESGKKCEIVLGGRFVTVWGKMLPYSVLECVTTQYSHSVSCISVIGPSLWCVSILPFLLSLFSISHWECIICDTAASLPYSIRMWQKRGKEKRRRQLWGAETFMRHFQRQMALLSACKSFFFLLSFVAFVAVPLCSAIK